MQTHILTYINSIGAGSLQVYAVWTCSTLFADIQTLWKNKYTSNILSKDCKQWNIRSASKSPRYNPTL